METVIHGGFPMFSSGRNLTRKFDTGQISPSFGCPREGGGRPEPRVFPGAAPPDLCTSGAASPSSSTRDSRCLLSRPRCLISFSLQIVASRHHRSTSRSAAAEPLHPGATALPPRVGTTSHSHLVAAALDPPGRLVSICSSRVRPAEPCHVF